MKVRNNLALFSWLILLSLSASSRAEFKDDLNKAVASLEEGFSCLGLAPQEVHADFSGRGSTGAFTPGATLASDNLLNVVTRFAGCDNRLTSFDTCEQYIRWSLQFLGLSCPLQNGYKMSGALKAAADSLDTLLPGAGRSLEELVEAERLIREAYRQLTPAEIEELKRYVKDFPFWDDQWPGFPVERMITLCRRVDLACLWAAALAAGRASASLREAAKENTQALANRQSAREP